MATKKKEVAIYSTIAEIRAANKAIGQHWFSRGTMRFFNCRIESRKPIHGRFFITSERYNDSEPRLYIIREALADGKIDTIGEFQQYKSKEAALRGLKEYYESL